MSKHRKKMTEINKTILKIQEKYVMEDWQDVQVNLKMCEEVWKEAKKELLWKIYNDFTKLNEKQQLNFSEYLLKTLKEDNTKT